MVQVWILKDSHNIDDSDDGGDDVDGVVDDSNGVEDSNGMQVWCSEDNRTCIDTLCPQGMALKVFF